MGINETDNQSKYNCYKRNRIENNGSNLFYPVQEYQKINNSLVYESIITINDTDLSLFASSSKVLRENLDFLFIRFYYHFLRAENWINNLHHSEFEILEKLLTNLISYESDFSLYELKIIMLYSDKNNLFFITDFDTKIIDAFFKVLEEIFINNFAEIASVWTKVFQKITIM